MPVSAKGQQLDSLYSLPSTIQILCILTGGINAAQIEILIDIIGRLAKLQCKTNGPPKPKKEGRAEYIKSSSNNLQCIFKKRR